MTIGEMIAERRKYLRMTQSDLADRIGVTQQAVCKWEKDHTKPDIWILNNLAEVLGYTRDELLAESPVGGLSMLGFNGKVCHFKNMDDGTMFGIVGSENARKWAFHNRRKYVIRFIRNDIIQYWKPVAGQKPHVILP